MTFLILFETVPSFLGGWWYFHTWRVVKIKLDVLKHMKNVVGAQEILVWFFGGHGKQGVEFF